MTSHMKEQRGVAYGTLADLHLEVEKLTAAGYTKSETRKDRQRMQFFLGLDINSVTKSKDRFVLIWDSY